MRDFERPIEPTGGVPSDSQLSISFPGTSGDAFCVMMMLIFKAGWLRKRHHFRICKRRPLNPAVRFPLGFRYGAPSLFWGEESTVFEDEERAISLGFSWHQVPLICKPPATLPVKVRIGAREGHFVETSDGESGCRSDAMSKLAMMTKVSSEGCG